MYVKFNWLIGVTIAFRFLSKNEVVRKYLRNLKFLPEKIRGLKIFSGKTRGLKFLYQTPENTPGGYMPLKMTTPLACWRAIVSAIMLLLVWYRIS